MATKKTEYKNGKIEGYIVVYRDGDTWDVTKETCKGDLKYYESILHIIPVETKMPLKQKIEDLIGFTVVV